MMQRFIDFLTMLAWIAMVLIVIGIVGTVLGFPAAIEFFELIWTW